MVVLCERAGEYVETLTTRIYDDNPRDISAGVVDRDCDRDSLMKSMVSMQYSYLLVSGAYLSDDQAQQRVVRWVWIAA